MEKFQIEGVIINAFSFQDYDRILSLFTPNEGLIKLVVKGAFSTKKGKGSTTTPLNHVEAIYTKGKGELYSCYEIAVLNHHLGLRAQLSLLNSACDMLQVITATQLPGKISPELYQLLMIYLKKLPLTRDPAAISTSFRLKTLRHEGLLGMAVHCTACERPLKEHFLTAGESFCSEHAPAHALVFAPDEIKLIEQLAFGRDFTQLAECCVPALLVAKVVRFFNDSL